MVKSMYVCRVHVSFTCADIQDIPSYVACVRVYFEWNTWHAVTVDPCYTNTRNKGGVSMLLFLRAGVSPVLWVLEKHYIPLWSNTVLFIFCMYKRIA